MPLSYENTRRARGLVIGAGLGLAVGMLVRSRYDEMAAVAAGLATGALSTYLYFAKDELARRLSSVRIGRGRL